MNYRAALEAAGAKIHEYRDFGSYQGDWWAKVDYQGKLAWVHGSYGSCSVCDGFKSEFGYDDETELGPVAYASKLADFGRQYLGDEELLSQEQALRLASEHADWDGEARQMVAFIKGNPL